MDNMNYTGIIKGIQTCNKNLKTLEDLLSKDLNTEDREMIIEVRVLFFNERDRLSNVLIHQDVLKNAVSYLTAINNELY